MNLSAHLEARDVSVWVGAKALVEKVNLTAQPGEFIGIIGPNGAGKSSLLRCLAGLLRGQGQVLINGQNLESLDRRSIARLVGILHQETAISAPFSVSELVMFGRYAHQRRFSGDSPADRRAVREALEFTGTLELAERLVPSLSGGERQRVLLAKVLAQETPVVLLDEPSASLDIAYQEQILASAARLARQGRLVIAVIHELQAAARHCSRLLLMSKARILADGKPEAVLNSAILGQAYGAPIRVWRNQVSGLFDIHPVSIADSEGMPHIHVIGGGGSAAGVLRLLGDDGYRVSAGVLTPGDSDLLCAGIYGMPVVTGQPFSPISDAAFRDNAALAERADLTILCNCAWGAQNIRNLEAAACARRLLILQDTPLDQRDFSQGLAPDLYQRLLKRGQVIESAQLANYLRDWEIPAEL